MRITIHQPEHLAWCGLLDKIRKSDLFVILDTVQFEKNYYHNRNKTSPGVWLTVPVKKAPLNTKIKDIEIDYSNNWIRKYLGTIKQHHSKDINFKRHFSWLEETINKKYKKLSELNIEILRYLMFQFNINTQIVIASELNLPEVIGGNEVVKQICETFKATEYLSGIGGRNYLKDIGVKVIYNDYQGYKYTSFDLLLCGILQF